MPSVHGHVKGENVFVHAIRVYGESRSIAPLILSLGTSWKKVVNFAPWSHYSRGRATDIHWSGGWM